MPLPSPAEAAPRLQALAERWAGNTINEKGSFQTWFLDFCDALGVPKPVPPPTITASSCRSRWSNATGA